MRPLGGEIELLPKPYSVSFTDSGRSSLRLFFKQSQFKNKKILIPNFHCEVIIEILQQEQVQYAFYKIDERFNITYESIENQDFDIIYVIHYFGNITELNIDIKNKILIEDFVFHFDFENRLNHDKWYAFNSYRKISPAYDGSKIKTNLDISYNYINPNEAPFIEFKKIGKKIKFNYLSKKIGREQDYLEELSKGEQTLNNQREIYQISKTSVDYLLSNKINLSLRKERFSLAKKELKYSLLISPTYYSFFILKLNNRDEVRQKLMNKNIFLPTHWQSKYSDNILSHHLLSLPLSENYTQKEFLYLINTIKKLTI